MPRPLHEPNSHDGGLLLEFLSHRLIPIADVFITGYFCLLQQAILASSTIRTRRSQSSTWHSFGFTPADLPPVLQEHFISPAQQNSEHFVFWWACPHPYTETFFLASYIPVHCGVFFLFIYCWHCTGDPGLVTIPLHVCLIFPFLVRDLYSSTNLDTSTFFFIISPDTFCYMTFRFFSSSLHCSNYPAIRGFGGGGDQGGASWRRGHGSQGLSLVLG